MKEAFHFIYKAHDKPSGLTEYEYDTVFTGVFDDTFEFNKEEVNAVKWMTVPDVMKDIEQHPDKYSFWFKIILEEMKRREII